MPGFFDDDCDTPNVTVGWNFFDSSCDTPNLVCNPTGGFFIDACGTDGCVSDCIPITIIAQPTSQIPDGSGFVTFTVLVTGTTPITYQWYEDDVLMEGEVANTLTVADTSTNSYYAIIKNPCSGAEGGTGTPVQTDTVVINELCKQYECDSLATYIKTQNPRLLYIMDQGNAGGTATIRSDGAMNWPLTALNATGQNPEAAVPATFTLDPCGDYLWYSGGGPGTYAFQSQSLAGGPPAETFIAASKSATIGGFTNSAPTGNGQNRYGFFLVTDQSQQGLYHFVQQTFPGGTQILSCNWCNGILSYDFDMDALLTPTELAQDLYHLVTMDYSTDGVTAQCVFNWYVNGVFRATGTDTTSDQRAPYEYYFVYNDLGTAQYHYCDVFDDYVWSSEQIANLALAFNQNSSTYVDPNPNCIQPPCKQYECDAYANGLLALNPVAYYPMNRAADLADYPNPAAGIKDYSIYGNHTFNASVNTPTVQAITEIDGNNDNCSGQITFFNTAVDGGSFTSVELDSRFTTINEWPLSNNFTYLVNYQGTGLGTDDIGRFRYEIDSGGRWTGCRLFMGLDGETINLYMETENWAGTTSKLMTDVDPDWKKKIVGFRTTYDGGANETTMELLLDFAPVVPAVTVVRPNSLTFGQVYPGPQHLLSTGFFASAKLQESALYNTALTDEQLLGLKALWQQSRSTYVDPNPNCVEPV